MSTQPVTLRSPSDLLAVIPHLLGFHPTDSLVVIALHDRRMGLLQRLDLPALADVGKAAHNLLRHLLGQAPDAALLVGYEKAPGASTRVMDAVVELLAPTGVHVQDRLVIRDGRWRSLDCKAGCCPEAGTPLPTPEEAAGVVAEFVGHGSAPLPSRADLASQLEPKNRTLRLQEAPHSPRTSPRCGLHRLAWDSRRGGRLGFGFEPV